MRIHRIPVRMAQAYLIEGERGLVLVDAGAPHSERRIVAKMRALGRDDLRLIYITHAHLDHYGSAAALRRLTGAPIAVHRADAQAMAGGETPLGSARGRGRLTQALLPLAEWPLWPNRFLWPEPTPPDLLLEDGDTLHAYGLDAVVLHTPGHTPGSTCLLVKGRLAFVGDLLSTNGRPRVQHLYADDWSLIPRSLARLQAQDPAWVFPGHGHRALSGKALLSLRFFASFGFAQDRPFGHSE